MAFEKLRTIVITAIPKPRSRERFRKIADTTPTPRKRRTQTRYGAGVRTSQRRVADFGKESVRPKGGGALSAPR
jgi:hypothetical protein